MIGVGETLPDFKIVGEKPKFMRHEENGESAFETVTKDSFAGKWKVIYFYPKDFTFVCPTEIAAFGKLSREFADRDAVIYGVSVDSEFVHLAWRQNHPDLKSLPFPMLADKKNRRGAVRCTPLTLTSGTTTSAGIAYTVMRGSFTPSVNQVFISGFQRSLMRA